MNKIIEKLVDLFTSPIFTLGDSKISLESIFTLAFWLVVLFLIIRLLSNWLKNKLLVKLGLAQGTREVVSTIVSYGVGVLGFVITLQSNGIKLDSLTFLAGGLGIGIGFALQDISQNFISGITLLFEQQIKVGDRIIMDTQEGIVKSISIRSTVIQTDDGTNMIVPNQSLVTSKVVNVSFGEPKRRIRIPFLVEQSADPTLVVEVLMSAAYRENTVLSNPPPQVLLKDFYNNDGLNLELLVWIGCQTNPDDVKSPINFLVNYEFGRLGIDTPASQRELSFANIPELQSVFTNINGNGNIGQLEPSAETTSDTLTVIPSLEVCKPKQLPLKDLLRKVVYFDNFGEIDMLNLIMQGRTQILAKDKYVFKENDPGDSFNIILNGSVEVFIEKANKHLTNLHSGDFFGELALIMGIPRTASVRTLENTTMFVVTRDGFQKLLSSYPDLADQIATKLAERKEELVNRQQLLRDLGLLDDTDLNENPMNWIRKRMSSLFGI